MSLWTFYLLGVVFWSGYSLAFMRLFPRIRLSMVLGILVFDVCLWPLSAWVVFLNVETKEKWSTAIARWRNS